jgi:alpha-tubulin suppressor-like RCC1 family protein
MTRREVLALLAALPSAARLEAQVPRPAAPRRVFLGDGHGLMLEQGTLRAWSIWAAEGSPPAHDALGLGHNRPTDHFALQPVPGVTNVVTAAAGGASSFAVLADGRVLAWGIGASGRLGNTPLSEFEERAQERGRTNVPTPLAVAFDAVEVSARGDHALALTRGGTLYAWGDGAEGQLGIGPLPMVNFKTRSARVMPFVPYPVPIPNLADVTAIAAGTLHSVALLKDGTVRAWGSNKFGQVGDGTTINRDRPVAVPGLRNVVSIAAGNYLSVAVLADGTVMEWGVGYTSSHKPRLSPVPIKGVAGIRSAAVGNGFVAAITEAGTVMTWGNSTHYETGRGNVTEAPGVVNGLKGVQSIVANTLSTTIATLANGRFVTWGHVRPWTEPGRGDPSMLTKFPIFLWLDGLEGR